MTLPLVNSSLVIGRDAQCEHLDILDEIIVYAFGALLIRGEEKAQLGTHGSLTDYIVNGELRANNIVARFDLGRKARENRREHLALVIGKRTRKDRDYPILQLIGPFLPEDGLTLQKCQLRFQHYPDVGDFVKAESSLLPPGTWCSRR